MATRKQRISDLAIRLATEFNNSKSQRGDLTTLSTTNNANLVAAINELKTELDNIDLTSLIDDASVSAADLTWSVNKIKAEIQVAKDGILNGAGAAYDTLSELAAELQANDGDIVSILTNQAKRVAVDQVQAFSAAEMTQGRANLDAASATAVGDTDHDFVVDFENGLS